MRNGAVKTPGGWLLKRTRNPQDFKVTSRTQQGTPKKMVSPGGTKYQRCPFEVCSDDDSFRFFVEDALYSQTYHRAPPKKIELTSAEKTKILKNAFVTRSKTPLLLADIDIDRIRKFHGKRGNYLNPTQIMHDTCVNKYVAAVMPELQPKAYWEWLHIIAFCFGGPTKTGPQHIQNLVAGTYECNRLMTAFENKIHQGIYKNKLTYKISAQAELKPYPLNPVKYTHVANKITYTIRCNGTKTIVIFYPTMVEGYSKAAKHCAQAYVDNHFGGFKAKRRLFE